jgi:hypothetical protein
MKHQRAVIGLAFASLFFAVLLPPEAYPDGKLAVILCATFAFFASLSERRISPSYIRGGLAVFGFLILHSLLVSVDTYRSLEFVSILWAYYCLFGFFFYAGFEPLKPLAVCMVVLCAIVSGYGLYQYFWGFDQLYSYVSYAGSDQILKIPALARIASRRVFSTLALPGTLWGFLIMALPFHASLWRDNRWIKAALSLGAFMLLATGFLTRSFGFLVGLFVLAAAWMILRHRQLVWRHGRVALIVVLVLALVGGAFYSMRRSAIEGANPVSLRAKNWISAWTIFAAHPMGTGLNTYGVVYSRYMLPGANTTQYTHNTPLQLLSEVGYPALIAGAGLLLLALRARRRGQYSNLPPYVLLALAVWAIHNMIDINVYFPSLGVLGAVMLGVLLRQPSLIPQPQAKAESAVIASVGIFALVFAALAMVSTELQFRAQAEYDENRLQAAAETLDLAQTLMPLNSSLYHDYGDINLNLFHRRREAKYLDAATHSFRRAIALSPEKSGSRIGLTLCLASANRVETALDELRAAQRRDPENTNVHAIARLLENRKAGISN